MVIRKTEIMFIPMNHDEGNDFDDNIMMLMVDSESKKSKEGFTMTRPGSLAACLKLKLQLPSQLCSCFLQGLAINMGKTQTRMAS